MLYKSNKQKNFKITYNNILIITIFYILSICIAGCSNAERQETSQITDTKTETQITDSNVKNQETQGKKLSELYDWGNARILRYFRYPNFGYGLILQNQDYVFYPEDGDKIIRINKSDGEKKIIYENKNIHEDKYYDIHSINYSLADTGLFIEYAGNIYFYDFEGENKYKIISRKEIKKQFDVIDYFGFDDTGIQNMYFYKNNLYLMHFGDVYKLDLSTKKITLLTDDVAFHHNVCLCNNSLYHVSYNRKGIYKTDITTGKSMRIAGNNNKKPEKYYCGLTEVDGKVYYIQEQLETNTVLYMYCDGKADKKIYEFDFSLADISLVRSDSGKIAIHHKEGYGFYNNVTIYDIKSTAVSKLENLKYFDKLEFFVGDMLFYSRYSRKHKNYLCLSYD